MSKIAEDPDNDPTGKHILIQHSGTEYNMLIDALDSLEQNVLVFLNSMLEGGATSTIRSEGNQFSDVAAYVFRSIDEDRLISTLHNYWKTSRLNLKSTLFKEAKGDLQASWISRMRRKVFLYYSFMVLLTDKNSKAEKILKPKLSQWEKNYSVDINSIVGRIEVQTSQKTLEVVYFAKPLLIRMYWENKEVKKFRKQTIYNLPRENADAKLVEF